MADARLMQSWRRKRAAKRAARSGILHAVLVARDDVLVIGIATDKNHGNIIPVNHRPIVIGKPEGRKPTFAKVVPGGIGDVDRRSLREAPGPVPNRLRVRVRVAGPVLCPWSNRVIEDESLHGGKALPPLYGGVGGQSPANRRMVG